MSTTSSIPVASLTELMSALSSEGPRIIELMTSVACPHSITLPPGFSLVGTDKDRSVLSFVNGDGIGLTANNRVSGLTVIASPVARAIYTQAGSADMGTLTLGNLVVTGQVSIIMRSDTDKLNLVVDGLHVAACDARRYSEQPQKYGVNDMVLDTWGTVDQWIAHAPVVSYGPSGIGFVNIEGGEVTDRTGFSTH
jgi:hypothetical protein